MKKIKLTRNQFTFVDDCDFEYLNQWKWYALWQPSIEYFYAVRNNKRDTKTHKQTKIRMHRLILGLEFGDNRQVDHINHDTLDNRRENLRIVTVRQNSENRRDQSNYGPGIDIYPNNKFKSCVQQNGSQIYLGMFSTVEEAQQARENFLTEKGLR